MPDEAARFGDPPLDHLRRLENLDELLPTLAGVLDIREVFERVSAIARRVLPHDMLALPLLMENRQEVQVYAITGNPARLPETVPFAERHKWMLATTWESKAAKQLGLSRKQLYVRLRQHGLE